MFRRFMYGRYGNDLLNNALLIIGCVFGLLSIIFGGIAELIFMLLQFMSYGLWAMRAFSKNIFQRRAENQKFIVFWNKTKVKFNGVSAFFKRLSDREHRYFKCPNCKTRLRVPRGRGLITVTCPKCKNKFDKKV